MARTTSDGRYPLSLHATPDTPDLVRRGVALLVELRRGSETQLRRGPDGWAARFLRSALRREIARLERQLDARTATRLARYPDIPMPDWRLIVAARCDRWRDTAFRTPHQSGSGPTSTSTGPTAIVSVQIDD